MTYKGKRMRRENITAEMVEEYIRMKGYELPTASDVLMGIERENYFGKTSLEEMIDTFQHKYIRAAERKRRKEEKRRIKAEERARRVQLFMKEA